MHKRDWAEAFLISNMTISSDNLFPFNLQSFDSDPANLGLPNFLLHPRAESNIIDIQRTSTGL
jgi:hypothetical protein